MGVGDGNTVNIPFDGLQFKPEGRILNEDNLIELVEKDTFPLFLLKMCQEKFW